ncbi:MAG: response regulator [Erysipelotrichales bacterium]|nr:response regulator [Erysipelotrichales bacterium]
MNEKGLIKQVFKLINSNYSNIYVIDIEEDKVYMLYFNEDNSLFIKNTITYTDFIEEAKKFVHKDEVSSYFDAISLNRLESESQKGNNETKVKYRKLSETGEYRWSVNIINYLPFEGKRLIFMMSEDINERLVDSEEHNLRLASEVANYKTRISRENDSISDAIMQINNLLDSSKGDSIFKNTDTKDYINSIFNRVSIDHPELNDAIVNKIVTSENYIKPTILIVDDSSIIRNSLKRIFDKEYNIVTANNGNEAIDIITKNILSKDNLEKLNIVAVLLDLIMPGSDGFVVLDFIKNFNLFSKIPIAIISGDETRETRKRVYEYDIVDMLEKPFNTETIRTRINKIIQLYLSSNNLQSLLVRQNSKENNAINGVMKRIVENITTTAYSINLKKIVQIITENLASNYPNYGIDSKRVSAIVEGCSLYNIGAIAMSNNQVVTSNSIKEEIEYGLSIINEIIDDDYLKEVTTKIIMYSCEMYNGSGYPDGISGEAIPIEAQITNLAVRLCNKEKSMQSVIKKITNEDANKYNKHLIEVINNTKKDLKKVIN